jgi:membrane protein YdbS with pleckstrin-like domain
MKRTEDLKSYLKKIERIKKENPSFWGWVLKKWHFYVFVVLVFVINFFYFSLSEVNEVAINILVMLALVMIVYVVTYLGIRHELGGL